MGNFNVQCMVSKMDILSGDDIVVFPLFKSKDRNNDPIMRINADWKVGLPIFGKYNDYGGVECEGEDIEQLGIEVLLNVIKERGIKVTRDSYQYCSSEFDPKLIGRDKSSDLENIINVSTSNDLLLRNEFLQSSKNDFTNYDVVSFAFIDKKIYDLMFENMENYLLKLNYQVEDYINNADKIIDAYLNPTVSGRILKNKIKNMQLFYGDKNIFYDASLFDVLSYTTIEKDSKFVNEFISEENVNKLRELLGLKVKFLIVDYFIEDKLHQRWEPIQKTGQALECNELKYEFNKSVNNILKQKILNSLEIDDFDPFNRDKILFFLKEDATSVLAIVDNSLLKDRDFALSAVKVKSVAIKYFKLFADDDEIAMSAIKNNKNALEFVSQRLKNEKKFVFEALKDNENAYINIGEKLKFELSQMSERPFEALKIMMDAELLEKNILTTTKNNKKPKI